MNFDFIRLARAVEDPSVDATFAAFHYITGEAGPRCGCVIGKR
ncbi:hypothetical protein [Serratia sp. JUb9]|nr:hypothetical protein [Serratia sp. JUb9]SQJ17811.1 Uncharacterised protein [Serratia rubidaea]